MLISTFYYWKSKLDKVIPIKVQGFIFLISFIIMIVATFITTKESWEQNRKFYDLEIRNKIDDINTLENGYLFKIDTNWYLIKHIIIDYISVGDSIIKTANSLHVIIKDSNKIKWDAKVNRDIIFRKIPK